MNLEVETKGGVVVARIGETHVGADTADELRSRILGAVPAAEARVAVDLTRVELMDSSGLAALVGLLKAVRPAGDLVLFGMRPGVAELLRLTHLDAVFPCGADEADALARCGAAPAS